MSSLLETALPVIAAPLAGGSSTPALVEAAMDAGGFGFLAAGYKSAEAMMEQVHAVRRAGDNFGVNLFVPQSQPIDAVAYGRFVEEIRGDADVLGVDLPPIPVSDDDQWREKLDALIADPVPVVSLTFGLPDSADVGALRAKGTVVLASVTTPGEARLAEEAGVDGLVVQGPQAGGHSATFDPTRMIGNERTAAVIQAVKGAVRLPLIAAGGVDGPEAVKELLDAGAQAVTVGTMLLLSEEAGTNSTHRAALRDPAFTETVITRAFTGRPARALSNGFIRRHEPAAITGYPAIHHLTQRLRRAAADANDPQRVHLWAGTGHRNARPQPAGQIIQQLAGQL